MSQILLPASFPTFYMGSMFLMRPLHFVSPSPPSPSLSCSQTHNLYSSQCMPIPLQPTFLHFLGYFSHLHCPPNSFIPNSVQLGDSTHFYHIQLLLLCFLHCPCHGTVTAPHIIVGLTTVLYTFLLTLRLILRSK